MLFEDRLLELKSYLLGQNVKYKDSSLSVESLLDGIIAVFDDCKAFGNADKNGAIPRFIQKYSGIISNIRSLRLNKDDFKYVRRLAKGQFGEVSLVRGKFDDKVYALKVLRKSEMLKQSEIAFFMEERQILAALNSRWITSLFASFQDESNLYLVMDYLPGGDLSNLIMKSVEGSIVMDEPMARFYIAETLLALRDLHSMNYIHRDLKPGNILLDANGHVKLADFGSCIQLDEKNGVTSQVTVGTPDYISPEVLQAKEGRGAYGKECDFWSLGITLYEMLVGDPPFYAESLAETYHQIMSHKEYFRIPEDVQLSEEIVDLLSKLICDKKDRLRSAEDITKHPFFKSINWETIHNETAPFHPNIKHDEDVSNFAELDDDEEVSSARQTLVKDKIFAGNNLAFIGYSYTRNENILSIMSQNENSKPMSFSDQGLTEKLFLAETECEKLRSKLGQESKRIASLESSQGALELELERVKKVLSSEMETLNQKENQIVQLDKEKKMLQNEMQNINDNVQQLREDKIQLELQIAHLVENLEKEVKGHNALKESHFELLETKARLESQLDELNKKAASQNEKLLLLAESISELNRNKAILELECENLKQQLREEKDAKQALQIRLQEIEDSLNSDNTNQENLQEALSDAENIILELRSELDTAKAQISMENQAKESFMRQAKESENEKELIEKELQMMRNKIEELSSKNHDNHREQSPTKTSGLASFFSSNKTNELSKQLEQEIENRKKANMELGQLSIEKVSLENQLREVLAKMAFAEKELKDLKRLLKSQEDKNLMDRKNMTMGKGTLRIDSQFSSSEQNLQKDASDIKAKLENKIVELQKQVALQSVEIEQRLKLIEEERQIREALEEKLRYNEEAILNESKLKAASETRCHDLESLNETIARDLHKTRMDLRKLATIKEKQDKTISDQANIVAEREMERDELLQKVANITRQKVELENETSSLRARLNELLNSHINPEEFNALTEECTKINQELLDSKMKFEELQRKYEMTSKYGEDETDSVENSKRSRMNITKMKALEQKLNVEIAKRAALETEIIAIKQAKQSLENELDEIRKQSIVSITSPLVSDRPHSALSVSSNQLRGSPDSSKLRRLRPLLFPENSKYPVMQGWLRLRVAKNSKKTKFDWLKRYAVLRDTKLFIYEKEKDKESSDKEPLVDMKANLFMVRAAKPNELIYLSGKEVSCVFVIQVVSSPHNSIVSLDDLTEANHEFDEISLQKKANILQNSIEKEEKFLSATEKMIAATNGDIKRRTQSEAEECQRRIKLLRSEKEDVEKSIELILSDNPTSQNGDKHLEIPASQVRTEIGKKEALRKGVQNMLQATENKESRLVLSSQLSVFTKDIEVLRSSLESLSFSTELNGNGKNGPKGLDQSGMRWYFMASDETDKQRWIHGLEIVRTTVKEENHLPSADIDSLLAAD